MNIYQTKKYSNSNKNMLSWRKTDETIWKIPFLREPPFLLNPLFLSNFLMTSVLVQISKTRRGPLILAEGGNYGTSWLTVSKVFCRFMKAPQAKLPLSRALHFKNWINRKNNFIFSAKVDRICIAFSYNLLMLDKREMGL